MLEEAGYNPFVEGDGDVANQPPSSSFVGNSFLESDFSYGANGSRLSFIETPTIPSITTTLSPPTTPNRSLTSSRDSPRGSPSLKVVLPPSDAASDDKDSLDNPFVNEPLDTESSNSSSLDIPASPTALPPSSPLIKSGDRLSLSPLITNSPRVPSPRLPSSPLASSSNGLAPPKADSRNYQSVPIQRSVVISEKADWVPDTYSVNCEHCGDVFTFIRRRHHCRVCGHLFCSECIVKMTLPATLGFTSSQKSCLRCAHRVVRTRGNFSTTIKGSDSLSIGQKLSGKMQNLVYKMAGMHEGGKFDRVAGGIASPSHFSMYQTDFFFLSDKIQTEPVVELAIPSHHDASVVKAHAYIPKGNGPFSILVYIPGTALVLDVESSVSTFCKELCCKVGCIVVCVAHRLAPEYKYPTQWEDCYSAVKWLYESSYLELTKLEKDPKIAVCGEGSGGLLAAAVCQMARDRGSPPIRYQLLITPWLNLSTLNVDKFEESYVLTKELMKWVLKQVYSEYADRDRPYTAPLLASSLGNLPPTKIITAGHDPLRFDAEEYAKEMRKHDVSVSVTRYENSMHNFVGNYADAQSELEEAVYECIVCLREVFGRGEPLGINKDKE